MLLITSVDEYLGFCIASHLSQFKSIRQGIRVLYQQSSSTGNKPTSHSLPWIQNFQLKGIDIQTIKDYTNPNEISQAMRNVDQMILTLGSHPNRVQHFQHMCKVALKSGVKSIIFLSHIGAQSESHFSLYDYGLIENYLVQQQEEQQEQQNPENMMTWTILRLDFIQQYFHLWASQVDQTGMISLPLSTDTEICPIDISDICHSIEGFVIDYDKKTLLPELYDDHVGQVYTLTGPEALTSKEILQMMSNATRYSQFKYHMVRPMDTSFYLKNLSHNIWFDARIKMEKSSSYRDSLENEDGYRSKAFSVPNGNCFLYNYTRE
jgi:hypothetical protein